MREIYKDVTNDINYKSIVTLNCIIHGPFKIRADKNYKLGQGCTFCCDRKPKNYWTLKRCIKDAKKYKTRSEWSEKSGSYSAAKNNGWFDECTKHMNIIIKKYFWTKENCIKEALKYKTRTEWEFKSSTSINIARKNKWMNVCTNHMISIKKPHGYWTLKNCIKDALIYKTKNEWKKNSGSAYAIAQKNKWLIECTRHMKLSKK